MLFCTKQASDEKLTHDCDGGGQKDDVKGCLVVESRDRGGWDKKARERAS